MLEGTRKAITPFWNRIPRFFIYPLYPAGAVILIAVLVLLVALPVNLVGMLLRAVVLLFFNKYCFEVLAQTAEGRLQPPALNADLFNQGYGLPFKQFAVFFVLGACNVGLSLLLGAWAGMVFTLTANLALPAILMVLAVSGSLTAALTPTTVFGLIWRIGWPYLILFAFLSLLSGGVTAVMALLADKVNPQTLLAAGGVTFLYVSVVTFNMMGYVVYQYHDALGLDVGGDEAEEQDPALADYRRFMSEQNYPAALEELRNLLPQRWEDLETHRLLHKLAGLVGNTDVLLRHGKEFIPILLDRGRTREAVDIYRACIAADPGFRPGRAEDYLPIAQMLRDARQAKQAVALINGFHKRFPNHEQTPPLYLLVAKLFHEELDDPEQARRILSFTRRVFPQHRMTSSIDRYLALLDSAPSATKGGA